MSIVPPDAKPTVTRQLQSVILVKRGTTVKNVQICALSTARTIHAFSQQVNVKLDVKKVTMVTVVNIDARTAYEHFVTR